MKENQTVRMMTPGQMKDIISATVQGVSTHMTFETAERWVGGKGKITAQVKKIFSDTNPYADLIADWQAFYHDLSLGINWDLSGASIPDDPGGFGRIIIMAKGIIPQSGYDLCAKNFPCWKYTDDDLDKIVTSERTAKNGPYAIRVRDRVEADEELKNRSARDLQQQGILGITIEEREIFELKYFTETGQHLDIVNWTLCAGSRASVGFVPRASCNSGRFQVHWSLPSNAHGILRSRQAVS